MISHMQENCLSDMSVAFIAIINLLSLDKILEIYCGIIVVRGGPIFVAFMGNPLWRIYIPTNIYRSISLIFIKKNSQLHYQPNFVPTNQENFGYPRTMTPKNINKNNYTVLVHGCTYKTQFSTTYPSFYILFFWQFLTILKSAPIHEDNFIDLVWTLTLRICMYLY